MSKMQKPSANLCTGSQMDINDFYFEIKWPDLINVSKTPFKETAKILPRLWTQSLSGQW